MLQRNDKSIDLISMGTVYTIIKTNKKETEKPKNKDSDFEIISTKTFY